MDGPETPQEPAEDGRAEGRVLLNDGPDEDDDVEGTVAGEEVHQDVHHCVRHLGETRGAGVDGLNEESAIDGGFILVAFLGAEDFALEHADNLLDVAGGDQVHGHLGEGTVGGREGGRVGGWVGEVVGLCSSKLEQSGERQISTHINVGNRNKKKRRQKEGGHPLYRPPPTTSPYPRPNPTLARTSRVFLQMSTFGEPKALKMSINTSCTTLVCLCFKSDRRSRMINFTFWSL